MNSKSEEEELGRLKVVVDTPSDVWLVLDPLLFLTLVPCFPFWWPLFVSFPVSCAISYCSHFDPCFMEWKIISHFTVKFDFEFVVSVRHKLLCDGGLHAAFCKAFLKARIKGKMHEKNKKL